MNAPLEPTEEQIAAAQLRIELDKKLGRETPEIVREIAAYRPTKPPAQHLRSLAQADQDDVTQDHLHDLEGLSQALGSDAAEALTRWRSAMRSFAEQAVPHFISDMEAVEALTHWKGAAAQYADIAQMVARVARRGEHSEAFARYRGAVQNPEPEVLNNLGNALRDLGRPDEAIAAYQEALLIYRREHAEDHLQRSKEHSGTDEPSASE